MSPLNVSPNILRVSWEKTCIRCNFKNQTKVDRWMWKFPFAYACRKKKCSWLCLIPWSYLQNCWFMTSYFTAQQLAIYFILKWLENWLEVLCDIQSHPPCVPSCGLLDLTQFNQPHMWHSKKVWFPHPCWDPDTLVLIDFGFMLTGKTQNGNKKRRKQI